MGLAALFIVTGCGLKGPLVMPDTADTEKESTEKTKKNKS